MKNKEDAIELINNLREDYKNDPSDYKKLYYEGKIDVLMDFFEISEEVQEN